MVGAVSASSFSFFLTRAGSLPDSRMARSRPDRPGQIGKRLLQAYSQLFGFWKTEYRDELSLSKKQKKRLRYFKNKLLKSLVSGAHCGHEKTERTCDNILSLQNSLWHFFENPNIPPTNNHAERQLRPLVISKKLTFGTQSDRGSRFIERIFTVVTSCRQQNRDVFAFITTALQEYFLNKKALSLVC